ncbi:hypothetical protein SS50377_23962 [Spironucleus salmonicida]|uniref:Uncharacterized protein n=1 Tax=Spironucleus salmonicida TaxID=348837 RepID=V6LEL5_9EUKA|nr:hypothetical protein SS50377_23962 [Spironucleus salmonicida]|eukprot:EST42932.1 Hypothetical protein SS50377_17464 [Spironucleus salmonicida]
MLAVLGFTCQKKSSRVEVNKQTNQVYFYTHPRTELNAEEKISCQAQSGKTGIYEIIIGQNQFRSDFIVYDAFKDASIILNPSLGASAENASNYVIASYGILFLDNDLIQEAVAGVLMVVVYDYNGCIFDQSISYETFETIQVNFKTNPKCIITPTADVMYALILHGQVIQTQNITKDAFDFSKLILPEVNCKVGTDEEKTLCVDTSIQISGDNFINIIVEIVIPKKIAIENKYTDDYGVEKTENIILEYNLIYTLSVSKRDVTVTCTLQDRVAFFESFAYIAQINAEPLCNFDSYDTQTFWVTASELADETGKTFQLQFYTDFPFRIQRYLTCETWEISEFNSQAECEKQLRLIQTYPANKSETIVYKLYRKGEYYGSYRFNPLQIPVGHANITLTGNQICVNIDKTIESSRSFASIEINISHSIEDFNRLNFQFSVSGNVLFPSQDNVYCFEVQPQHITMLQRFGFGSYFGVVSVLGQMLHLTNLEVIGKYDEFWEGWVLMISAFGAACIFVVLRQIYAKRHPVMYIQVN